jgi:DNA-directed RNA polymerase subunit E'/Rpb7
MTAPRMTSFKPVFLDKRVALSPIELRDAAGKIDDYLVGKIRKEIEGQCCTHGYVKPGSTQILARSMGQAEHGRFTADFIYQCKVRVRCYLPYADQVVEARVLKVNKLGAYALMFDEGRISEAMRILIPRDLHLSNAEFEALDVGQGIRVRIMRSRFQNNDAFIQTVGMYDGVAPAAAAGASKPEEEIEAASKPTAKKTTVAKPTDVPETTATATATAAEPVS